MDSLTVYVLTVIFLATLIRSILGFGEALVAVPLLAMRIPIVVAAPLAVLVSITVAGVVVVQDWQKIELRSATWLIISSLFGIPLGLFLLTHLNSHITKMILGVVISSFALYSLTARTKLHLKKDHAIWIIGSGFCAGVLGGAYGMNGPPLVVYGSLRQWSPQHFRATLQGYFFPSSLTVLAGYAAIGPCSPYIAWYFLLSLPGTLVASILGRVINSRLSGSVFYRYVYTGLMVIGCILILEAFRS